MYLIESSRRLHTAVALVCMISLTACDDDPAAPEPSPAAAVTQPVSMIATANASALVPAELVESEAARIEQVLAAVPHAAGLRQALSELSHAFQSPGSSGRSFEAAQLVLRRIEELNATEAGSALQQDLDALRLMLAAFEFEQPLGERHGKRQHLNIW